MASVQKTCAIIIPCYNEASVIFASLTKLTSFLDSQSHYHWTLVVVSDGSTDETAAEVQRFIADYEGSHWILFHNLSDNVGKGSAIQAGLKQVDADYYGFIDADLSLDYTTIVSRLPQLFEQTDIIIAKRKSRTEGGYSKIRAIGSKLFSSLARTMFRLPYTDMQCGLKFFTAKAKDILLTIEQSRFSFDVEFLLRARQEHLGIHEHIVAWKHTEASSVTGKDAVRYVLDLFSMTEIAYSRQTFTKLYIWSAFLITAFFFGWTLRYGYFFSHSTFCLVCSSMPLPVL